MFDDPKKELERLQEQLLKDEDWFEKELDSAKRMIGQQPEPGTRRPAAAPQRTAPVRNYANGYGQPATQFRELVLEEPPIPKKKGIKGLLILAAIETLGILGLGAYWALFLLK